MHLNAINFGEKLQSPGEKVIMLKRKITDYLSRWKENHGKECLLVNGARQVGKSYAITRFGQEAYDQFIAIDFVKSPELKSIFARSLDADEIYSRITLSIPGAHIIPGKTLLFLDELQECPEARSAFKYLAQDGRCDVIGSGSLLGVRFRSLDNAPSLPVGYERQITMGPLDFEEYLWARGFDEQAVRTLQGFLEREEAVPQAVNERMSQLLREHIVVGGMPAVVESFLGGLDFGAAHEAQLMLHNLYLDDVAKYAPTTERVKARACYLSLPRQLAKENTKFQYSVVEKRAGARKFESSVDWLIGAEVTLSCRAVSTISFPLASYEDGSRFRLYANDTGLLMAMFDFSMKAAIVDDTLSGPMKGGIYENVAACILSRAGIPLRYWASRNGNYKIEFVAERAAAPIPIEVKASRGSTASLNAVLANDNVRIGYKCADGANIDRDGKKTTIPLYMLPFVFKRE